MTDWQQKRRRSNRLAAYAGVVMIIAALVLARLMGW